jgi:DeoR/GlpR family transcriptional regulator of sugar metabolism
MKRALSRRAADTFVLASAEKVGAASPFLVLPISDVSGIVTDAPADDPTIARIAATGMRVIRG